MILNLQLRRVNLMSNLDKLLGKKGNAGGAAKPRPLARGRDVLEGADAHDASTVEREIKVPEAARGPRRPVAVDDDAPTGGITPGAAAKNPPAAVREEPQDGADP